MRCEKISLDHRLTSIREIVAISHPERFMKRLFPALVLVTAACSQDITGPKFASVADLSGRWNLAGLVLVGVPDSSKRLDVRARFGLSATLSISPGGRAVIT